MADCNACVHFHQIVCKKSAPINAGSFAEWPTLSDAQIAQGCGQHSSLVLEEARAQGTQMGYAIAQTLHAEFTQMHAEGLFALTINDDEE